MRVGPLTFLFAVTAGWTAIRVVMLWPEEAPAGRKRGAAAPTAVAQAGTMPMPAVPAVPGAILVHRAPRPAIDHAARPAGAAPPPASPAPQIALADAPDAQAPVALPPSSSPVSPIQPPQPMARPASPSRRFSVSSWAIMRGNGPRAGLAAAGQLGGSQAGIRMRYDLGSGMALAARISGPLRQRRGKEAAIALDWRPAKKLPLTFTLERRAGLDPGGRDAFAAGAFGGFDGASLPLGLRADGYAQAGVVGLKRRDLYADGALRMERTVAETGKVRIGAGAGLWGGAQPGVSRLDVGPQVVAHAPLGPVALRAGFEWRARLAGTARPGSGPALSIGADF